jgi:predicted kinase
VLQCSAPLPVIRERLDKRRAFGSLFHGGDASADDVDDALQAQLERSEPLTPGEQARTVCVDTGQPADVDELAARIRAALLA